MPTPLSISDMETTYEAILKLVLQYPGYPSTFKPNASTVMWNSIPELTGIGLFPLQGAMYLRQYISGSYIAQFPFRIAYKSSYTTNDARIAAQKLLDDLGKWLETCAVSFTDNNLSLETIRRTSPVFIFDQDTKTTTLTINMQLNYSYKKG